MKRFFRVCKRVCAGFLETITLLSFFFQINTFKEFLQNERIKSIINSQYFPVAMFGITFVSLILFIVSCVIVKQKENEESKLFHRFYHELRDKKFSIAQNAQMDLTAYNSLVKDYAEHFCSIISDYLKAKYGKDFRICIKMIDIASSLTTTSINEMKVYTLARRKDDLHHFQPNDGPVRVSEDTSYSKILTKGSEGDNKYFGCHNLIMYTFFCMIKGDNYLPPLKSFIKRYMSTVVVPIRIDSQNLSNNNRYGGTDFTGYQVFGFLCLDYKHIMSKKLVAELSLELRAFADALYLFFDEVTIHNVAALSVLPSSKSGSKRSSWLKK